MWSAFPKLIICWKKTKKVLALHLLIRMPLLADTLEVVIGQSPGCTILGLKEVTPTWKCSIGFVNS